MANGRVRTTRRQIDPWAVYDALPAPLRAVLQEGPQEWDAVSVRNHYRKRMKIWGPNEALRRTVRQIEMAHAAEINEARPWQTSRLKKHHIPSPHILANATMQTSGRDKL